MAEAAEHHQPSFQKDRELSNEQYPFLETVDKGTPDKPSSKTTDHTKSTKKGRPPLSSYLDPADEEEFAFTSERIEENYPFFGTLMKRENGLYKRKEVIPRSKPKTIEYVKERYKGGAYQVRQKLEGGEEQKVNFNVSGIERPQEPKKTKEEPNKQEFVASVRRELKEEIREDYKDEISRLKRRLDNRNEELDELARKNRNLNVELAKTERESARNVREETKEFERKIDQLKEEKRDLEFENFELQQELKWSDADGGFDLKGMLKEAANNPDLQKLLAPLLAKLFGGGQPMSQQQPPAALSGATQRPNPQQPPQNNAGMHDAGESVQPENPQPDNTQNESPQEEMQHMIKQFSTQVIQNAASSMLHGQPGAGKLKKMVMQGVKQIESNGMEIQPGMWVGISKALVEFAIDNSITAEKAAETIEPILEQFDGAANSLQFVPAKAAAKVLINQFNIQVNEQQKDFLVEVLSVFKQKLNN